VRWNAENEGRSLSITEASGGKSTNERDKPKKEKVEQSHWFTYPSLTKMLDLRGGKGHSMNCLSWFIAKPFASFPSSDLSAANSR
jgi:hypothetical protein